MSHRTVGKRKAGDREEGRVGRKERTGRKRRKERAGRKGGSVCHPQVQVLAVSQVKCSSVSHWLLSLIFLKAYC